MHAQEKDVRSQVAPILAEGSQAEKALAEAMRASDDAVRLNLLKESLAYVLE